MNGMNQKQEKWVRERMRQSEIVWVIERERERERERKRTTVVKGESLVAR